MGAPTEIRAVSDLEFDDLTALVLALLRGLPIHVFHYINEREKKENPALTRKKVETFNWLFKKQLATGQMTLTSGDLVVPEETPYILLVLAPIEPNPEVLSAINKFPPTEGVVYAGEYNLRHMIKNAQNFVTWAQSASVPFVNVSKFGFCNGGENPDTAFSYEMLGPHAAKVREFMAFFNASHMTPERFILREPASQAGMTEEQIVAAEDKSREAFAELYKELEVDPKNHDDLARVLVYLSENPKDPRVQQISSTAYKKRSMLKNGLLSCDALAGGYVAGMLRPEGIRGSLVLKPMDGKTFLEVVPGPGNALQLKADFAEVTTLTTHIADFFQQLE